MQEFLPVLKKCPLFQGMCEEDISVMLGCLGAYVADVEKGGYVFSEGDEARQMGVVLKGQCQVVRDDFFGNRSIMASVEPGQMFGESFACAGMEALPVSVLCTEASRVMLMDCRRVVTTCSNQCLFHQQLVMNLLRVIAQKNLAFSRKMDMLTRKTTREKVMAYLLEEAKKQGKKAFVIPFDRQGLADYLGVERSALSAEISKLKKEGVLDTDRSFFELLDRETEK